MKIIGLMLTWNNLEFFRCAVMQALDFCDELILVDGCHSMQCSQRSDDGTIMFIQSLREHPKLKIKSFIRGDRYDYIQRHIRQEYPKQSQHYEPGNWVFQWDDDYFLMDKDLQKLRNMMQYCKEDSLAFMGRWFSYNFKFNTLMRMQAFCYRITDGLKLKRVSRVYYKNGQGYSVSCPDDIIAFHYSHVKRPERMKARYMMSAEKGTPGTVEERFGMWKDIRWDKDEDILNNDNMKKVMAKGELNIYEGPHPEMLDNHPWRYVDDVRSV